MNNADRNFQLYFKNNAATWTDAAHRGSFGYFPLASRRAQVALDLIKGANLQPGRALDVGCGPAIFAGELVDLGYSVLGVDFSQEMIRVARENPTVNQKLSSGRLEIVAGEWSDVTHAHPEQSFDLISALGFVYYLPDLCVFLKEASRLLRPGGHLVVSFRNSEFRRDADELSDQVRVIYRSISQESLGDWMVRLSEGLHQLGEKSFNHQRVPQVVLPKHNPDEISSLGRDFSFAEVVTRGVHAHLLHPALDDDELSPLVDLLSIPLENAPQSELRWFSHFIVLFKRVS